MEFLDAIEELLTQGGGRRRYRNTPTTKIIREGVVFLDKSMKLDPRDRPSPQELLQDQWISSVMDIEPLIVQASHLGAIAYWSTVRTFYERLSGYVPRITK